MFRFPKEIRHVIYTINVIESLNDSLRKITKMKPVVPTEEVTLKLLWRGLRNNQENVDNANSELEFGDEPISNYFRVIECQTSQN